MITLTEQQLLDIIHCPALFEMKYVRKLPIPAVKPFSSHLSTVSNHFYTNLLDGKVLDLNALKRKWDSICVANEMEPKKVLDGMNEIFRFGNWMSFEKPMILDIDTPYTIYIDGLEVKGNLSPVFVRKDKKREFVITSFSNKLPDQRDVDMRLKHTLHAYAYEQIVKSKIDGIRVHSVKHNKDFYTQRTVSDYNRLISTLKGVKSMIENHSFYARDGILCTSCPAVNYCKYWTMEQ